MNELSVRTCISTSGEFVYGIHKPDYTVVNLRGKDHITTLGHIDGKTAVENKINFPANDVTIDNADWVFEISNSFPFMGATFILKSSADKRIENANPFDIINKHKSSKLKAGINEFEYNDPLTISLCRSSPHYQCLPFHEARYWSHAEYSGPGRHLEEVTDGL